MKALRSLEEILTSCAYNKKVIDNGYYSETFWNFHWQVLIHAFSDYYDLPYNWEMYSARIDGFGSCEKQEFDHIKWQCREIILEYQLLKITESCSFLKQININSITESQIRIGLFLFKVKQAYGIDLEKWQIFTTSKAITLKNIVTAISCKVGYDSEAVLFKEELNAIIKLKYCDPVTEEEHQPQNNTANSEQTDASGYTENASRSSFYCSNKKDGVETMYRTLVNDLNSFKQDLSMINAKNPELKNLKSDLVNRLQTLAQETKIEAEKALHEIPWDRLVIAFFGETNAGKSTIIETFRILFDDKRTKDSDGLIVGDGRQDFTQDYHEYNFSINSRPFTLIDVPGIEGNESEFKDIIKEALRKAHCVFYVQGHNKKPDSATAKKIKNYLGNWVNVYSIQNIRGSVSDYDEEEERETLLTPNVLKNEGLIRNVFKEILGDVYKGNIPLHALLGMCAKAQFSDQRPDLQKNQTKLLKYFDSSDEILKFSQFQTIINLVNEKSNNFTEEITNSNRQKVISLCDRVNVEIEAILNQEKENTERLRNRLIEFQRDSKGVFSGVRTTLQNKLNTKISNEFNLLKQSLFGIIDKGGDSAKKNAKRKVEQFKYSLANGLNGIVEQEIDSMKEKLKMKKKKLEGIKLDSNFDFNFFFHVDIDTEDALNELELNLDDIGDFALSAAGTAGTGAAIGSFIAPGIGTLIGGIVGGVVGGVARGVFHNDGKGDAKNMISQDIENSKQEVKKSISSSLNELKCQLRAEQLKVEKVLHQELANLETVNDITVRIQQKMNATMQKYKN